MARNDDLVREGGEPDEKADVPVKRVWGAASVDAGQDPATEEVDEEKPGRKKVTGADLEARWAEGASNRSAAVRRATSPRSLRAAATTLLVLVALGAMVVGNMASTSFQNSSNANQAQIKDLEDKIAAVDTKASTGPDQSKMSQYVTDAQSVGGQVASAQNSYLSTTGASPEGTAKRQQIATQLDGVLAEGSARNARVPWAGLPADVNAQNSTYSWKFVSATPSADVENSSQVNLLWTFNNTTTGDLYSWATGVYDGPSKKIVKVSWGRTLAGVSMVPSTDSSGAPPGENASPSASPGPSATGTIPPPTVSSPIPSPTVESAQPSASSSPSPSR